MKSKTLFRDSNSLTQHLLGSSQGQRELMLKSQAVAYKIEIAFMYSFYAFQSFWPLKPLKTHPKRGPGAAPGGPGDAPGGPGPVLGANGTIIRVERLFSLI